MPAGGPGATSISVTPKPGGRYSGTVTSKPAVEDAYTNDSPTVGKVFVRRAPSDVPPEYECTVTPARATLDGAAVAVVAGSSVAFGLLPPHALTLITATSATHATMWVTNGGDARCDRSRLFSSGWTEFGNKNWAGAPFPFTQASGSQYDYFLWDYPAESWAMRSWWQIDDAFSGGLCDYGGGVGLYPQSYYYSTTTETVPSP